MVNLNKDPSAYFIALGQFFEAFSSAEMHLLTLLWRLSGVDERTGKAIFYSLRVNDGIATTKRLYKARGEKVPPHLARALTQLNAINKVRNAMIHNGTWASDNGDQATNLSVLLDESDEESFDITPESLTNMMTDLGQLFYIFTHHPKPMSDDAPAQMDKIAWLYKP